MMKILQKNNFIKAKAVLKSCFLWQLFVCLTVVHFL